MHWPYYDRTTWGLIFAIAALVLAIPLSVVGNLINPHIRDWWARRSVASLQQRIATRQKELERVTAIPEMTEHEELMTLGLYSVAAMISIVPLIFIWTSGMNMVWAIKAGIRTPSQVNSWFFGVTSLYFAIQVYLIQFQVHYQKHLNDKSPTRRQMLAKALVDLKAKLDTMLTNNKQ
jgi:hypothetical protein